MPSGGRIFFRDASRRENLGAMLCCILVALSIWLLYNLSRDYSDTFSVNLRAVSNIDGRKEKSDGIVTVDARVRTSGYNMLKNRVFGRRRVREVLFPPEVFVHVKGDEFSVASSEMSVLVNQIFGKDVILESFSCPAFVFRFTGESCRKVPVAAVQSISFKPQFISPKGLSLSPDSVLVYGENSLIDRVERVLTRPLTIHELESSRSGTVKLDVPKGTRLSIGEVKFSIDVARYVEVRRKVRIQAKGCPPGKSLSIFPSDAEAVFKMRFPVHGDKLDDVSYYVDYKEFSVSRNGNCVARTGKLPEDVFEVRLLPEIFECVENEFR